MLKLYLIYSLFKKWLDRKCGQWLRAINTLAWDLSYIHCIQIWWLQMINNLEVVVAWMKMIPIDSLGLAQLEGVALLEKECHCLWVFRSPRQAQWLTLSSCSLMNRCRTLSSFYCPIFACLPQCFLPW